MFQPVWLISVVGVGASWLCVLIIKAIRSPLASIPGPRHSVCTSLYLILQEFASSRRMYIHRLHQKYGPVVRLGPNEVSFTSLEALKEIYTSGGSGYDKTEFYTLFMQFETRTMFSTLAKGAHSVKKRQMASQYAYTNIMRPQIVSGIQDRASAFIRKCNESKEESMDAYFYLHCFALDCASHFLFHPYGTRSIETEEDLKLMRELSYHDSLKRYLSQYYWPSLTTLFLKLSKARTAPLANEYVISTCQNSNSDETTLLYKLQSSKNHFNPTQIAAECMDHMAAGIDTTGDALCFLMYQLSSLESQYVQEKLFQELKEYEGNGFEGLKYLDAVVKEGLRCFPPIPMSQPRYVPAGGRTIDGFFIPGETIVSCQAYSVHRLNEDVFLNGDKFLPERWLEKEKVLGMNRLFFSFGAGGRGCTGQHLAIVEMKCLLREVYSRFHTRVAEDMKGDMSLSDQIISSRPLDQTCRLIFERRT